jgi:RNA polymerase sigma-70 factor (ECF subfamily)
MRQFRSNPRRGTDRWTTEKHARNSASKVSFREIHDQTFVTVTRLARYLGVRDGDLDDLVQEVFIAVHRRLNEFEARASVKTWVASILRLLVQNYRRTQRRKSAAEARWTVELGDMANLVASELDPSESFGRTQAREALQRVLRELPEDKASVFVMVELEGMTVPEIAESMDANINTIYGRLRAARKAVDDALARLQEQDRVAAALDGPRAGADPR